MNCPDCGISVEKDAKFCPKCYARIEPPGLLRRVADFFKNLTKPVVRDLKSSKTVTLLTVDRDGNRHEYHSINEVPLAMRSQFEEMESKVKEEEAKLCPPGSLAQGKAPIRIINHKSAVVYKIKDASGQERTCESLEEVPAEMRALLESAGAEALKEANLLGGKTTPRIISRKSISIYKLKDASGQERTYHSLDELPPEIRDALQRIQPQTEGNQGNEG